MIYAILLDDYQDEVEANQYAVTFSGTLEECRARKNHGGNFAAWLKSDFTEASSSPCQLEGPTGAINKGRIVGLNSAKSKFLELALPAAAALTAAVGIMAAVRSRRSKQRAKQGRARK